MSLENHPNIHAVQFTMDILESIKKNLRGIAGDDPRYSSEVMRRINDDQEIVEFVADISTRIDDIVGIKKAELLAATISNEHAKKVAELYKKRKSIETKIMLLLSKNGVDGLHMTTDVKPDGMHWNITASLESTLFKELKAKDGLKK